MVYKRLVPMHPCLNCPHRKVDYDKSNNACRDCDQIYLNIDHQVCAQCIRILQPYIDKSMIKCDKHIKEKNESVVI